MPKTRRRKKEAVRRSIQSTPDSQTRNRSEKPVATRATVPDRRFLSPGVRGPQNLIFSGMVALGCWGLAFSFLFFSTDPNHVLFGGMAVLMALLWSFSLGIRVRKLLLLRQRS